MYVCIGTITSSAGRAPAVARGSPRLGPSSFGAKNGVTRYSPQRRFNRTLMRSNGDSKSILSDSDIPEGHRELHEALYGDDAKGSAHTTRGRYRFIDGEDDGTGLVAVPSFLRKRKLSSSMLPPMGVFAIYDSSRALQYVSYSRNIVLSVKSVLDIVGEEKCAFVRNMVFQNKAMQTRQAMEAQKETWIEENGTLPPGNGVDRSEWEIGFAVSSMSDGEKETYDDKKTKMVAAMGQQQDGESLGKREKLKAAVEGGDWSSVIDEQSNETIASHENTTRNIDTTGEANGANQPKEMTTPFVQAQVHRRLENDHGVGAMVMNKETVDKALDEVRPYLQADGGDVEVVEVEDGRVLLRLQGQCSSCTASESTMSMGIERSLKANFGDQLKEVIEVGGGSSSVATTMGTVNAAVMGLRGAIEAYGGTVEVDTVEPPHAVILYTGVKSLAYGLKMALLDQFKDLNQITFMDGETGDVIEF
jgi:Fe-S cluster biogenesis protein NfuA